MVSDTKLLRGAEKGCHRGVGRWSLPIQVIKVKGVNWALRIGRISIVKILG